MPAPRDPSHKASETATGRSTEGNGTGGADRFWEEFSRARPDRRRRGTREEEQAATSADPAGHECLEWCPICRSADLLRAASGPEVRHGIASVQRESLLALRTLIDGYLARSTERPPPPAAGTEAPREPRVQDIPLD